MDVSASVLPELKRDTYGHIQFCAKQKLARHGSLNSVQASEKIQRKVNSEPSSPHRDKQGICLYWIHGLCQPPCVVVSARAGSVKGADSRLCLFWWGVFVCCHLPKMKWSGEVKELVTSQRMNMVPCMKLILVSLEDWRAIGLPWLACLVHLSHSSHSQSNTGFVLFSS